MKIVSKTLDWLKDVDINVYMLNYLRNRYQKI